MALGNVVGQLNYILQWDVTAEYTHSWTYVSEGRL